MTTDSKRKGKRKRKRLPEKPGRPFKLTEERIDRICQALATGASREVAARFGGLVEATYYRYVRGGRAVLDEDREPVGHEEELMVLLVERIEVAEVDAELRLLGNIATAGEKGDWRAAAHILACRWPQRWAAKNRHEVSGPDGGPVEIEGTGVLPILARHALAAGEQDPVT